MQKLAEVCIRRPVFAAMLILALVVVGSVAYGSLGVDRFPSVDVPTVSVRTVLPGGAPEDVETEVTEEIEKAVNTVEGIRELRSVTSTGVSMVIATFELNRDIDAAADDVRSRVQTVLRDLPPGTDPPIVTKQDNDSAPVMTVALSADRSVRELTELADKVVRVQLERSTGVGEVRIVGGQERAIKIWVDADRLNAYGLPITAVRDAIVRENASIPAGNVTRAHEERTLRTLGRFESARAFEDLLITSIGGRPVRIRDIGHAEDGSFEQRSLARLNGTPTVVLELIRQSGSNTVAVIESAKAALGRVQSMLPDDVKLEVIRDQTRYIYAALHEINLHLVMGSVLACLVVLAFMRSWRSTIIAGVAIPASVVATFSMMWWLGFTLNSVTMLALVLMVGIVIDDAIVVLENIFRFVEEKKLGPFDAAREATREIGLAVLATTLSLVVIFVPVSFMSSISGRFLFQFGITAAVAVMVSLLVSFTLTPMMSARLLKKEEHSHDAAASRTGFYARLDGAYERALRGVLRHRALGAVVGLAVIVCSVPLYRAVKQEYVPSDVDEAEFEVRVTAPLNSSISAMDSVMRRIDEDIRSVHGVTTVVIDAGGGFIGGVNQGNAFVRIEPHEKRVFSISRFFHELFGGHPLRAFEGNYTQRDVMQQVRQKLKKYTDLRTQVRNAPSFNIGGGNFEIDMSIQGPDLVALERYTNDLRERSLSLGGIIDSDTTLKLDRSELRARVDRERAADLGVRTEDIATALRLMVGGDERVSRYRDANTNENYEVQLRLSEGDRDQVSAIRRLQVPRSARAAAAADAGQGTTNASAPGLVPLESVIVIDEANSPSRIDRLDRQRVASLRAGVGPGYALADRLEALRGAVREMNLPPEYTASVRGRGAELERTFTEFIAAFALSILLMYMILAAQFESLIHPLTILVALPLSVPFALFSLWATGNTLNLYSALGLLVLFGVVKKNSILQVDHMNQLRASGMPRYEAILRANRDRLRPILMTTLALVAGMIPLWVGTGPGAEERRTIAVVVIGGQSLSLALTLIMTPLVYSLMDDLAQSAQGRRWAERLHGLGGSVSDGLRRLTLRVARKP
ncbi:MAG TPA: efflux RND transporter permease subunit [Polyangiaceae bacterium]|nr:efflux RND transporter permease subunit [Polyangiaceae bacterium]